MKEIYTVLPEKIGNGKDFNLEKFLQENNIDPNNPEIAEKVLGLKKAVQSQKELTRDALLTFLAYYDISAIYTPREQSVYNFKKKNDSKVEDGWNNSTVPASKPLSSIWISKDAYQQVATKNQAPDSWKELSSINGGLVKKNLMGFDVTTNTAYIHLNDDTRPIAERIKKASILKATFTIDWQEFQNPKMLFLEELPKGDTIQKYSKFVPKENVRNVMNYKDLNNNEYLYNYGIDTNLSRIVWKEGVENVPTNALRIVDILNRNLIKTIPEQNIVYIRYNDETAEIAKKIKEIPYQEWSIRYVFEKEEKPQKGFDATVQLEEYEKEAERQKIIAKYGSFENVQSHYRKLQEIIKNSNYDELRERTMPSGLPRYWAENSYYEEQEQILQKYLDDNPKIKKAVEERDYLRGIFGVQFVEKRKPKWEVYINNKKVPNKDIKIVDNNWHQDDYGILYDYLISPITDGGSYNHPNFPKVQITQSWYSQSAVVNWSVFMSSSGDNQNQYINHIKIWQ